MVELARFRRSLASAALIWMPVFGIVVAMVLAELIREYSPGFVIYPPDKIVGAKLAFLSVMMALGMFQYKFLYDEMREFNKQAYADDYGPQWMEWRAALKAKTDALAIYLATDALERGEGDREAELRKAVDDDLNKFKDAYGRISAHINALLVEYSLRLSIAFTIGFTLLVSIALDLARMCWPEAVSPYAQALGQVTLVCAIGELLALLLLFVGAVRSNVRQSGEIVDQLGTVAQS